MAGLDTNKISNILGTKLPQWLIDQLGTRAVQGSKDVRDNDNILYLANKSSWVRLVSSINIYGSDVRHFSNVVGSGIQKSEDLAKQFVLFGGTSKYLRENTYQQRAGIGKDGAYGILGDNEVREFGYRPMPGLTSVNIETQGRLGSLRAATINFRCWDKNQLDIIDALYFKLGFTMFLEWGNTFFYRTNGTRVESSELYSIDPFRENLTKEEIAVQISKNVRSSEGNYDAMLGMVTNFNFSYNQEGGYDCTIRLMGLGILGDGIKINNPRDLPNILAEEIRQYNNTLIQISTAEERQRLAEEAASAAAAKAETEAKQISLLRFLNKEINKKDKEPDLSDIGNIIRVAGIPNSKAISITNYDYLYNVKNREWSLIIPKFGVLIPSNNTKELVESIAIDTNILFDKITQLVGSPAPAPVNLNPTQANPLSVTNFTAFVTQATQNASIEDRMFGIAEDRDSRSNQIEKFIEFSYNGTGLPKYPIRLTVSFDKKNPNFPGDSVDVKEIYLKAVTELRNSVESIFTVESFEIDYPNLETKFRTGIGRFRPAIIKDANSLTDTQGRRFLPILVLSKDLKVTVREKSQEIDRVTGELTGRSFDDNLEVNVQILLSITDTALITNIVRSAGSPDYKVVQDSIAAQNTSQFPAQEDQSTGQEASIEQITQALQSQSGLELTLRTIQVHALNKAIRGNNNDLSIGKKVFILEIANEKDAPSGTPFYRQIFSNGIYSDHIGDLVKSPSVIQDSIYSTNTTISPVDRFRIYAKYGFATELLSGRENISQFEGRAVNYKELLRAFVVPYEINQEIVKGTSTTHPVYIPLGLLLMILNHNCSIYDTKDTRSQTPLVYVDYNPNLNFFLCNSKQLSTNPWVTLIPFEGTFNDYQSLFLTDILTKNKTAIAPLTGTTEESSLFNPQTQDLLSYYLPSLKSNAGDTNIYKGKIMNVLLNIDYLVKLVRDYSFKDGSNSIYLKTFIEQVISDINKYLGNFNSLRLAYNDGANTYQIVDDQVLPPGQNENILQPQDNRTEIPLVGKTSIARSLEIKTEISSKLSNMIAISANSDVNNKATLSVNGDNFGFINTNYKDRFIPVKGDVTTNLTSSLDSAKASATQFNRTISDFYSKINPSEANVSQATNYYIERMSKIKNDDYPTRASTMIPVSVNFTTDGISGLTMGQAFTISSQLLPYTYNNRIVQGVKGLEKDRINKVGFVITGLSNTIESNKWNTAVKGSMIFLKDATDFSGSFIAASKNEGQFGSNPENQSATVGSGNTKFTGTNAPAKAAAEAYLGRVMSDTEWSQLVSATFAEASRNQEEEAWVMAVILNRTRTRFSGALTITDTLTKKSQFQSVTGTKADGYKPSINYLNGPGISQAESIYGAAINILSKVPKNYLYFTSNNPAAYGPGTDITFLDKLKKQQGSTIKGGTVFSITA